MLRSSKAVSAGCVLALLVSAAVFSACGSDSSDSTSASSGESTSTEAGGSGLSGAPIKIGLVSGLTGVFSQNLGQVGNVAKVWEEAVNESGGINGSPVEVIVKDDGSDPSKAQVAARELVSEDVVAVAGSFTTAGAIVGPYLIEHGIPMIGGAPNAFEVENGAGFFPSGGNNTGLMYGVVAAAAEAGLSRMAAMYCAEYPTCKQLMAATEVSAEEIGDIEIVSAAAIAAASPSYTAQCLQAKQADADSMFVNTAGPAVPSAITDCEQQGVDVQQLNAVNNTTREFFENPISEGMIVTFQNMPASDASTPGGKYFNEMVDKYGPEFREAPEWNEGLTMTWAGLQLFKKAAELGKVDGASKPEAVFDGLYQIKDYTIEGLAPALSFEKDKGLFVNCWFAGEISEGSASASSSEAKCIPDDQAPAVLKAFEG